MGREEQGVAGLDAQGLAACGREGAGAAEDVHGFGVGQLALEPARRAFPQTGLVCTRAVAAHRVLTRLQSTRHIDLTSNRP